jgi:hypothetical protein
MDMRRFSDAEKMSLQRPVLLTVPHAYALFPDEPGHPLDNAAETAAKEIVLKLRQRDVKKITLMIGKSDRWYQGDLNRFETSDNAPEEWVKQNPDGILLDIHSFPKNHNWKNPISRVTRKVEVEQTPLVILMPIKNTEFAMDLQDVLGPQKSTLFQGSNINRIINIGLKRSILLEFAEDREEDWPIDEIVEFVVAETGRREF